MRLREVTKEEQQLQSCIDIETGEVNIETLQMIEMQRMEKITNLVHIFKEYEYESEKFKAEIEKLTERKRIADNAIKSLKNYIEYIADGQKIDSITYKIAYRKSESIEIDEILIDTENLKTLIPEAVKTEIKYNKIAIKNYYKQNGTLPKGVTIVEKNNIQIK